jgi:hypothetical protein
VSDAFPTPADKELVAPIVEAFTAGEIGRNVYWHATRDLLQGAHPRYSGHDVTRVARILAPFPLRDGRYAPR